MKLVLNAMQVRAAKSGVGQYIYALVEALLPLLRDDDELCLYTSHANTNNYRFANEPPQFKNIPWGLPENRKVARLFNEYMRFPAELRRLRPTLVHGLSNFLPLKKTCPAVLTIHDLSYFVDPARCPFLRRHYWYTMTARSIANADAIITDSENSRRDIARFFPRAKAPVTVVPLAAHGRFKPLGIPRAAAAAVAKYAGDAPYLLYVGTLEPGKNVDRLIRAFDAVAAEHPDYLLLLAGDKGWLIDRIYAAANAAGAKDRIRFIGHIADNEVVELMNFARAFVFPSLYEGFGLPPLEAMSCGTPVITSNTSSLPEVTGPDAAINVDPRDEGAIADAMRRLITDDDLAQTLKTRGLERAKLFSWTNTAKKTYTIYEQLANRR